MNALTQWTGVQDLRARFRAEGFGVPDFYATIASQICDGVFTSTDFIEESEARAVFYVASGFSLRSLILQRGPSPPFDLFAEARRRIGRANEHRMLYSEIRNQKLKEATRAAARMSSENFSLSRSMLRSFAEQAGKPRGFVRTKMHSAHFSTACLKTTQSSAFGYFVFSKGGRGPHLDSIGMQFLVGMGDPNGSCFEVVPELVIAGMQHYDLLIGKEPYHDAGEEAAQIAQIGVMALVAFFDLFVTSLGESIPHNSALNP